MLSGFFFTIGLLAICGMQQATAQDTAAFINSTAQLEACNGFGSGENCTFIALDVAIDGVCLLWTDGIIYCLPPSYGFPGGRPTPAPTYHTYTPWPTYHTYTPWPTPAPSYHTYTPWPTPTPSYHTYTPWPTPAPTPPPSYLPSIQPGAPEPTPEPTYPSTPNGPMHVPTMEPTPPHAPPSPSPPGCPPGSDMCGDPHMNGLRGQRIDWSGVDGGWYCLVRDADVDLHVNVRLTAPLPDEFPDRQLITGLSIVSEDHSLVIEVTNPYTVSTDGFSCDDPTCLANGGLRAVVDGNETDGLLRSTRDENVAGSITISASNLPVECRQFGGETIWARMYEEMLQGRRQLRDESFEDWVLSFDHMAAPDWCEKYVAQHGLNNVQSSHAIIKIVTSAVVLRLNVGIGSQVGGDLNWDGRVLPELDFWQMDIGLHGLTLENAGLSGILGETARPVLDEHGREVMEGYGAFRGTVEDYRVSCALGTEFALLGLHADDV